jgi:NAD(P)-dependent dehydrogenase (short-subunit alcohol dehydrogenase family)
MQGRLTGRVVLVTGAGSGIGRASARVIAREGAKVVVSDVNAASGAETVTMIERDEGEARFLACDVSRGDQVKRLIEGVVTAHGKLDGALNNAGVGSPMAMLADFTEEEWDRVVTINLKGVWLCMKEEIRQMLRQGGGVIVNISSVAGLTGFTGEAPYSAAKHGVVGLTKVAALEYATQGIRVNAVCPGAIDTPILDALEGKVSRKDLAAMEPVGRLGRPEEIGEAVAWLLSDASSFVTGAAIPVDGGWVAR